MKIRYECTHAKGSPATGNGAISIRAFRIPPELLMDEIEMTHLRIAILLQILVLSRVGGQNLFPLFLERALL
jgi:hypothetical protein